MTARLISPGRDERAKTRHPGTDWHGSLEDAVRDTYTPKTTPDTIHDYIGTWACINELDHHVARQLIDAIPRPGVENLPTLVDMLDKHLPLARERPGRFIPGNVVLGAPDNDYVPSCDELLASELENAIRAIINSCPQAELARIKQTRGIISRTLVFHPIIFHHVDVMGSGRFFHAVKGEPLTVQL